MTKGNDTHLKVDELQEEVHREYVRLLTEEASRQNLNYNRMTIAAEKNAAMTYRMLDPHNNITLKTMVGYALVLGKKLKIDFVDIED